MNISVGIVRRGFLSVAGSFLVSCLFSCPAIAQDLPNLHTVSPGIYRGAAPTTAGLRKLKEMGIRTIIDLRISPKQVKQEQKEAQRLGFQWLNLPMGSEPPTTKQVSTLLATLKKASAEPVFVHCQHGADRTGCMIGIWRVNQENWSYEQTYKEMRRYGFKPHYKKLANAVRQRTKSASTSKTNPR